MGEKYFCTNCKYSFTPKSNSPLPNRCPYCDKKGTIEPVKTMQEWLDEVQVEDA